MSRFEVRETYTNTTTNSRFGESDWILTGETTRGGVFRSARGEFGAPVSRMYLDRRVTVPATSVPPFPAVPVTQGQAERVTWTVDDVGWIFRKRMVYEDARPEYYRNGKPRYRASDYYMREVWVEVREIPDISAYYLVGDDGVTGTYDVGTGSVTDTYGDEIFTASDANDARAQMRTYLDLKPGQVMRTIERPVCA